MLRKQYNERHPSIVEWQSRIQRLKEQKTQILDAPGGDVPFMGTADNIDLLMPKKN